MRAIVVDRWMEPGELTVSERPAPVVGPGQLGVEVRAAGCNFFDILLVQGRYQVKPAFPFVPGGEVAGVVREVGAGVTGFAPGDRVLAAVPMGGYAERIALPAAFAHRMPEGMSFEEGAALPIVYPTSYAGLVFRAALQRGETLLVHAAAGGVGLAAVQIGKALGARVIATAGGVEKLHVALEAGADIGIDYSEEDFVERVKEFTGGRGADVIYDSVGGDVFDRSLKCIAWNGRLLVIGFASGTIPTVAANRILLKNVSVVGLHWGAYAKHEPARVPETFAALFRLYAEKQIRPVIYRSYPLEAAPDALAALGSRKTHGKVVLRP
ncbi:MAG TPA: NADPH:quinone oxidoreductase family protein [Myxococcota bacterium]|nr:NADPH:quinone oxidoreductase family protein [Myxococcota bacterium]